jgi:hypothetical protein
MPWLIVQAFVGLLTYDVIATASGFTRLHAVARRWRRSHTRSRHSVESLCRAVAEACVWYPKRAYCLQRSWVACRMLRRHGVSAHVIIGYRPAPIDSHAWVEVDGQVVNDRPQYQKAYQVLDRL